MGAGSQVPDLAGDKGKLVAGLDARSTSRATAVAEALLSWSTARATAVSGMQGLASSWRRAVLVPGSAKRPQETDREPGSDGKNGAAPEC